MQNLLSDKAWSLVLKLNLLWRHESDVAHCKLSFWGLIQGLQDDVGTLRALGPCPLSMHVFCFALLTLPCAFVNEQHALHEAREEPCSVVSQCCVMTDGSPRKGNLVEGLYRPANAKRHPTSLWGERPEMSKACEPNFPFSVTFSWSLWPFRNCVGN